MAIPYYTPEGIGPVDANNNSTAQRQNTIANTQVNRVTLRERPQQPINIASFPHQLIQELYSFYQTHIVTPQITSRSQPTMEPQRVNNTDNQRGSSMRLRIDEELGESQPLQSLPLPDIIECHAGLSVDFTYEGCLVDEYFNNRHSLRPRIPSSNNNEPNDRMEELPGPGRADWRLQLKLLVGPWQQAGMELRAIADHFQLEYTDAQQRSSQRRRRLKCKLMVSVGIPTLAIVGLGIAWLRRH
ncbi:unnamed protein product [Allacma fusca]|uniref:Uncharacterized protein n=1 Tax=Allacma fusca TaxID=39272 RepID=A0A8J2PSI1_9HEXA|nr:unnamed protein product [Allacma fusca]